MLRCIVEYNKVYIPYYTKYKEFMGNRNIITQVLRELSPCVLTTRGLQAFIKEKKEEGLFPKEISFSAIKEDLSKIEGLEIQEIGCPTYGKRELRYLWQNPSALQVALSLKKGGYLSHGSAVFVHGLNDERPFTVYLNQEQSIKPSLNKEGALSQEALTRAFANNQRESKLIYNFSEYQICMLSGKHTGALEVREAIWNDGSELLVTSVERTLIDIAVRPNYSGGVERVLEAYKGAKERCSINVLLGTLKKLDYLYPYHQSIGFYMERAGWDEKIYSRLLKLGTHFDFYLTYGMRNPVLDSRWRMFHPEGF
jgi:hypothetical protein